MNNLNTGHNNDQRAANIRQLFDSVLTGNIKPSASIKNGERWYTTNCPLPGHKDKKPSFSFNYSGGWHCFTCNKKGDAVHLAKELNIDPKPYYFLAEKSYLDIPKFLQKKPLRVSHKKQYKYFEDKEYFFETMKTEHYNKNPLALYYREKFGMAAKPMLEYYLVGTHLSNDYLNGAAIFWYLDLNRNICRSKIQLYDNTGHRVPGCSKWEHHGIPSENVKKPLYGEWIARDDKRSLCIVEGEKTANAMSLYAQDHLWLSSGGANGLHENIFDPYDPKREILFYPDIDAGGESWKAKAEQFSKARPNAHIKIMDYSDLWRNIDQPIPPKADLADYFFEHEDLRWDPEWED